MPVGSIDRIGRDRECPLAFATIYLQEHIHTTPEELHLVIRRMERYAESRALAVTETFIEPLTTRSRAIAHRAMIATLKRRRDKYLIVPGVHHFADLGENPLDVLDDLKALDVQVIIAGHVE